MITFGTLFLIFCLYELQELNCYKHVFKNYLQVFEMQLKFVII
jgi:hypothetical protein